MKVGIQLYSVKESMAKDPLATIEQVADLGYRFLEVANHCADKDSGVGFGVSADALKPVLQKANAQVVSAHMFPLNPDGMDDVLAYHKEIGTKYIAMPMGFYTSRAQTLEFAALLNKIGERCAKAGIQFVYHNHFHEFQKFEGETVFDTLMNNTDKDLLKVELDTYWAMRAGKDPVELLRQYGKRICLIHQKDYTKGHEDKIDVLATFKDDEIIDMNGFISRINMDTFTEIGTGIMDIQSIIDVASEVCGVEYIILEQDATKLNEIESIKVSMEHFKKFKGIEW